MKRIVFFLIMSLTVLTSYAQRNLPGQIGVGLTAGTVDGFLIRNDHGAYRYCGEIFVTRFNANKTLWRFSVGYLQKDYPYRETVVQKAQFTFAAAYMVPVASDRRSNFLFSIGGAVVAGYETVN